MNKERLYRIWNYYTQRQWKFAALGLGLLVAVLLVLHFSRQYMRHHAMDEAVSALEHVMNYTDNRIHETEAATDSILVEVEQHLDNPDMMFELSRRLLSNHPDLKGCSIAFEPYFFKNHGRYFSAYSYNNGNSIETEQEGDDGYQYFYMDWYLIPFLLDHKYWIEPFQESGTDGIQVNDVMTSYCQPIYNANGKPVGILSADVPLKWLSDLILSEHPMPHSYCMLLGRGGSYIVHPDRTRILYETIFTSTLEKADTARISLGRAMVDGETGYKSLEIDGQQCHVFYMPFRQTGWSIALVCPDKVILYNYLRLLCILLPIIILSLMLIFLPFWRWLHRHTKLPAASMILITLALASCQSEQSNTEVSKDQQSTQSTSESEYALAEKYYDANQFRSAIIYYKKAVANEDLLHTSPQKYYDSFVGLHTCYSNINNLQEALAAATKGYQLASKDTTIIGRDMANNLLMQIGISQLKLSHANEAAKTFEQVRRQTEELALAHPENGLLQESCLLMASNIINGYLNRHEYKAVEPWLSMMEQALERYAATDVETDKYEHYLASLLCYKAVIYAKTGRKEEADVAYRSYIALPYAQTYYGIYNQAYYLEITEQWQSLLDIQLRIDSAELAAGIPPTLDFLIESPATTFKALLKTNRKEEALQRAQQIISLLDSVKNYQHQSDAEELAVIYETQQKEAQIAQQKEDLNHQRMIGAAIVFVLLIVFLGVLHAMYRKLRKAHAQLEISYQNLVIANERAEESSKMKSNFIRQMSHEIRTPLNILSGFTQIITMSDMTLDNNTRQDINTKIMENTDRITGLVNKMIELSDANSTAVIERTNQVLAIEVAAKAADASGVSEAAHVAFDMKITPEVETLMISTNENAAVRALTMILDNARKFTRPAEAKGDASIEKQNVVLTVERNADFVSFIVEDTGIGIPVNEAEHIFDEFVQLDEYYDGTGIGLTIARSLTRRLGGDIVLDSSYITGARFVMTLPV